MPAQTLRGACACGRNRYVVEIPPETLEQAELRYDNTSASRESSRAAKAGRACDDKLRHAMRICNSRVNQLIANMISGYHSAAPLTVWLRVPLPWFTSATFAQYPDETRSSIRRSFISPFTSEHRRTFCGYCGTQLTSWTEQSREDADHISLTVGSLLDEDQELLEELGFFPGSESSDEDTKAGPSQTNPMRTVIRSNDSARGAPWFEEMVQNTRLGRFKQQRGGHSTNRVQVEWEVMEWTEGDDADDEGRATPSKRKISEVEAEDREMRNA